MGFAMGDVKYAMNQPFYLNYANPASYGSLAATTFSVGAVVSRTRSYNSETTQDNDNGSLRYFGLGIPITKRLGIAIGARPYTSIGYGIQIDSDIPYPSPLITRYEGNGGMTIIYGGIGAEIIKDSSQILSVGVNSNFFFGNSQQSYFNSLDNNTGALSSLFRESSYTSDFGFDLGLTYQLDLDHVTGYTGNGASKITIGATYSLPTDLKSRFESFSGAFYTSGANVVITDTLNYSRDTTSIYMPQRYGVGLNYEIFNKETKSLWILEADYEATKWADLRINKSETSLTNSQSYMFGFQFIPDSKGVRDFFKLLSYRGGITYRETRILIGNEQMVDLSVSGGFGIPLVRSKSVYPSSSTVDFGVVVGSRGTTDNGLIREQYTHIYIGLSFSPNYWDRWFQKRKIN